MKLKTKYIASITGTFVFLAIFVLRLEIREVKDNTSYTSEMTTKAIFVSPKQDKVFDSFSLNGKFDWFQYFAANPDANCIKNISQFWENEGRRVFTLTIPPIKVLNKMDRKTAACLYHRYVTTIQKLCSRPTRFGNWNLEGGNVCEDRGSRPGSPCFVYVFSDKVDYKSFALDISNKYHCDVNVFGPRNAEQGMFISNNNFNNVRFNNNDFDAKTIISALNQIKQQRQRVNVLSIDLENRESDVLSQLLKSGCLDTVDQLIISIYGTAGNSTIGDYTHRLMLLSGLRNERFFIFWFERNLSCQYEQHRKQSGCYKISLMRSPSEPELMVIPNKNQLDSLKPAQVGEFYHNYINTLQYHCKDMVRIGRQSDGGWEVCNDKEVAPNTKCLVYSFGIMNEYSFDDDVAVTYNCEVHSFDPSDGREDYRHAPMVWFHNTGISDFDGNLTVNDRLWKMRRLKTIKNELGHSHRKIDILKMDVENSEWRAIPDMIESGLLVNVTQLLFECHIGKIEDEDEAYKDYLSVLKLIYDQGFRIFWSRKGTCLYYSKISGKLRTACQEIYTVKINVKKRSKRIKKY